MRGNNPGALLVDLGMARSDNNSGLFGARIIQGVAKVPPPEFDTY